MYHYTLCGLPDVYLENGYTFDKTPYGESVSIQDIKGLHRVIGLDLVQKPDILTEAEIRFLRKEMDLSQKCMADLLGVKEITFRKWEAGAKINATAERLLRGLYADFASGSGSLKSLIEELAKLDKKTHVTIRRQFTETKDGWRKQVAA